MATTGAGGSGAGAGTGDVMAKKMAANISWIHAMF